MFNFRNFMVNVILMSALFSKIMACRSDANNPSGQITSKNRLFNRFDTPHSVIAPPLPNECQKYEDSKYDAMAFDAGI